MRDFSVGTDTINYLYLYDSLDSFERSNDYMWVYLNSFIYDSELPFNYVLFASTFIILFFIVLSAKKFNLNVGLSLFYFVSLFFYFQSFNISRQFISVSIILYSVSFIKLKNGKHFLGLIFYLPLVSTFFCSFFCASLFYTKQKVAVESNYFSFVCNFILGGIINIGYLFRIIDSNFVYFSLLENNQDLGLSVSRLLLNIFVCYLVHKKIWRSYFN